MPETTDKDGYTKVEREAALAAIRVISNRFYAAAAMAQVHGFIEFAGLMNEYITMCCEAEEAGIPWMHSNTHSGVGLPFKPHNAAYLGEKLDCIYGPSMTPENKRAFIKAFLGDDSR